MCYSYWSINKSNPHFCKKELELEIEEEAVCYLLLAWCCCCYCLPYHVTPWNSAFGKLQEYEMKSYSRTAASSAPSPSSKQEGYPTKSSTETIETLRGPWNPGTIGTPCGLILWNFNRSEGWQHVRAALKDSGEDL